jgi:hypothetical protein
LAIALWQCDRTAKRRDAIAENIETQRRIVGALRSELSFATQTAMMSYASVQGSLTKLKIAKSQGQTIKDVGGFPTGTFAITEAVIYRALASDLGHLRADVVVPTINYIRQYW